jgi:hypothetical protein
MKNGSNVIICKYWIILAVNKPESLLCCLIEVTAWAGLTAYINSEGVSCCPTFFYFISSSFSVGTGFINECMWFRKIFEPVGQQSKLSGLFTAKIIQYLQIITLLPFFIEMLQIGHLY